MIRRLLRAIVAALGRYCEAEDMRRGLALRDTLGGRIGRQSWKNQPIPASTRATKGRGFNVPEGEQRNG